MKRLFSLLLAALILTSCATGGGTEDSTADTTAPSVSENATSPDDTKELPNLPEENFGGYEFKVLTRGTYSTHWTSRDVYAEEETGEPINDAVYQRNMTIGEKYGFKIVEKIGPDDQAHLEAKKVIEAGEDAFDLLLCQAVGLAELSVQGYLMDLKSLDHLDLSRAWYDQSANSSVSFAGKQYLATGDLCIMDNDATWAVLFNKPLADELKLGNLYDLVKEGKWTIDRMTEMATKATADLNGDGKHDSKDQWGLQGESFNTMAFIHGCGAQAYAKDKNDIPVVTIKNEHFYDAFAKALALNGNFDLCMYSANFVDQYTDVWTELMDPAFTEGRVLFNCAGMNRVTLFRDMEADFGILPVPKYDEDQDTYHCLVSLFNCSMFSVPKTAQKPDRSAFITEALSAESMYTLTPAYYEKTLKFKSTRDSESAEMLDLVFGARVFDMGNLYYGTPMYDLFSVPLTLTSTGSTDLASNVTTYITPAETYIKTLTETYANFD